MVDQIEFTQFAKKKLRIIHKYYSENVSGLVAINLVNGIINSTSNLQKYPESGQWENYESVEFDVFRSVKYKRFKAIYVVKDQSIIVLNVFDMRQSPERLQNEMRSLIGE